MAASAESTGTFPVQPRRTTGPTGRQAYVLNTTAHRAARQTVVRLWLRNRAKVETAGDGRSVQLRPWGTHDDVARRSALEAAVRDLCDDVPLGEDGPIASAVRPGCPLGGGRAPGHTHTVPLRGHRVVRDSARPRYLPAGKPDSGQVGHRSRWGQQVPAAMSWLRQPGRRSLALRDPSAQWEAKRPVGCRGRRDSRRRSTHPAPRLDRPDP